ncbi:MAG: glycogen/starch/alpha-glucan phosphorylase [Candidatus Omnitrophica bacterium]|nr:glycogen/starch/alpha-glucan phosphorylase [Candidatus Omnitrophota bacterium]
MDDHSKKAKVSWKNIHRDMSAQGIKLSFLDNRCYALAKDQYSATVHDNYLSLSVAIRDRIVERWINTQQRYHKSNLKRVYYLSMEFLIGRMLGDYIYNLGLEKSVVDSLIELGFDIDEIREQEMDAGLGNGGLGRLAACFLDSMAALSIPAHGYGIRYDYGIFKQKIDNGYQIEIPDEWLRLGSPWEFCRPEYTIKISLYGRTESYTDETGTTKCRWVDTEDVLAVPYDMPVVGYKNDVVNTLRLWSARSTEEFDFDYFNHGDYEQAVYQKIFSENISKVLYPNDSQSVGRELRLKQEYFFTAASIADIIRRFKSENTDFSKLPEQASIQLNDTHPAIGVVELMRVLIDKEGYKWDDAWKITKKVFSYTNHTLMPEALETWSVDLLKRVLPRHLMIIYEINSMFLKEVGERFPGDSDRIGRMSIIEEGFPKKARMAYLSIVGSHSTNGVSRLHSDLLKTNLFKDFYDLYPEKFNNKTNGITQRRWLLKSNPGLSGLITETIGDKWVKDLEKLNKLLEFKEDKKFIKKWQDVKLDNKEYLAAYIKTSMNVDVNLDSIFDVQIKRMHEYKRQALFCLYGISQYLTIKNTPKKFIQPRTFIFGGKAAPAYTTAKMIIKLINNVSNMINNDRAVGDKLKMVFLENYRVSLAEKIFPASELSEQISLAGTEASGTGNMKFMLNGALTVGTLDGANVEMAEQLNNEDIFIFGLKEQQVTELKNKGYNPQDFIQRSPMLKEIYEMMKNDYFSPNEHGIFNDLVNSLFHHDPFLVCADFDAYLNMQDVISKEYQNKAQWTKKSITNVARSGYFSSDRTIRQYASEIWGVPSK